VKEGLVLGNTYELALRELALSELTHLLGCSWLVVYFSNCSLWAAYLSPKALISLLRRLGDIERLGNLSSVGLLISILANAAIPPAVVPIAA
jgi:hypothetical protein